MTTSITIVDMLFGWLVAFLAGCGLGAIAGAAHDKLTRWWYGDR